jgi:hypothetical protein
MGRLCYWITMALYDRVPLPIWIPAMALRWAHRPQGGGDV